MRDALEKAVVFLASIPESLSAALINSLEPEAIERLANAASSVQDISTDDQQRLAAEFVDRQLMCRRRSASNSASTPLATLPEAQRNLADLQRAPADWLAHELSQELPQTAAVVICHLNPTQAADVLGHMSTEAQLNVVQRIACAEDLHPEILAELLEAFARRRRGEQLKDINHAGGLPFVAQVVNRLDRATERALLQNLAHQDRSLVDQLLRLMFVLRDRSRVARPTHPAGVETSPTSTRKAA